jgi:hypothetical protein
MWICEMHYVVQRRCHTTVCACHWWEIALNNGLSTYSSVTHGAGNEYGKKTDKVNSMKALQRILFLLLIVKQCAL